MYYDGDDNRLRTALDDALHNPVLRGLYLGCRVMPVVEKTTLKSVLWVQDGR